MTLAKWIPEKLLYVLPLKTYFEDCIYHIARVSRNVSGRYLTRGLYCYRPSTSYVEQQRTLAPDGLLAAVKQQAVTLWWDRGLDL